MVRRNSKRLAKTTKESLMSIPKLVVVAILAGIIVWALSGVTVFIAGLFTTIGDFGVLLITVVLALTVFAFAMGMKKGKMNLIDLIPVLIVAPLVVAGLSALNLGAIPVIDSNVEFGATLGIVVASVIFANNVMKQFGFFK